MFFLHILILYHLLEEVIFTLYYLYTTTNVRKMALNGYILHIDLAPVKELISLQRRCSNNLNQVAIHAHTYGVYPEEIDGLKRDYEKLWGEVSKVLRELSELVAK